MKTTAKTTTLAALAILGIGLCAAAPAMAAPQAGSVAARYYSELDPYGDWHRVPHYGWVWQPEETASNAEWRPYLHGGRWLHTSRGWYWHSDYAWGRAPFHYGRWLCTDRYRWVWIPGTEWAPAWVHWRHSSRHYGWAPLPPGGSSLHVTIGAPSSGIRIELAFSDRDYVFVPSYQILAPSVRSVSVPHHDYRRIFHHSIVGRPPLHRASRYTATAPSPHHAHRVTQRHQIPFAAPHAPRTRALRANEAIRNAHGIHKATIPHVNDSRRLRQEALRDRIRAQSYRRPSDPSPTLPHVTNSRRLSREAARDRLREQSSHTTSGRSQRLHSIIRDRFGR